MTAVATFRALHADVSALLLPNVWDAASARLFEHLGARAIATTSAGLAWACGYPDGDVLPIEELLAATARIARVVHVPLSIDIEAGGSDRAEQVAETVLRLHDLGVAGINIEDGGSTPQLLCRKIEAIRRRLAAAEADVFINVRTDVLLRGIAQGEAAAEEIRRRGAAYRAAGADGLFVPGLADPATARTLVDHIVPLPLNLMLVPGLPSPDVLYDAGVRRLSAGSQIAQQVLGQASELAAHFLRGQWDAMQGTALAYGKMNGLLVPSP